MKYVIIFCLFATSSLSLADIKIKAGDLKRTKQPGVSSASIEVMKLDGSEATSLYSATLDADVKGDPKSDGGVLFAPGAGDTSADGKINSWTFSSDAEVSCTKTGYVVSGKAKYECTVNLKSVDQNPAK